MHGVNYVAIIVTAVAAFVEGWLWYSPLLFGKAYMRLRGVDPATMAQMKMPVGKLIAELGRCLVIAYVLARLVHRLDVVSWRGAVHVGAGLWLGFPATLLVGSVLWDNVKPKLALIHAGDWLVKLLFMTILLTVWR